VPPLGSVIVRVSPPPLPVDSPRLALPPIDRRPGDVHRCRPVCSRDSAYTSSVSVAPPCLRRHLPGISHHITRRRPFVPSRPPREFLVGLNHGGTLPSVQRPPRRLEYVRAPSASPGKWARRPFCPSPHRELCDFHSADDISASRVFSPPEEQPNGHAREPGSDR